MTPGRTNVVKQQVAAHWDRRALRFYHNCSSFWTFFARSEGYRQGLETTHNPKVASASQAPVHERLRAVLPAIASVVASSEDFRNGRIVWPLPALTKPPGHWAPIVDIGCSCSVASRGAQDY